MVKYSQIKAVPLAEKVCEEIKKMILSGELPPGTRLNEQSMAKQMAINHSSIREAFRLLGQTGLVKYVPYKGTFVAEFTGKDIYELYTARALLEGYAAERSAANVKNNEIAHLKALAKEMLELTREGRKEEVMEKDLEFHEYIWRMSNHARIYKMLQNMKTQIQLYFQLYSAYNVERFSDMTSSADIHEEIIKAFEKESPRSAKEALSKHIETSGKYTLEAMSKKNGVPSGK